MPSFIPYKRLVINFILTVHRAYANLNDVNQAIWSKILTFIHKILLAVFITVAIAIVTFAMSLSTNLRFEVEVIVNTPTGPKSGSRVYNVRYQHDLGIVPPGLGGGKTHSMEGEAISVEVLPGQFLFVLIGRHGSIEPVKWVREAFSPPVFGGDRSDRRHPQWVRAVKRSRGKYYVPKEEFQNFVAFADRNNPLSIFELDPNDLSAAFGPGTSVASFSVEMVNAPVTYGQVEALLPWLTTVLERSLCPQQSGVICRSTAFGDFLRRTN